MWHSVFFILFGVSFAITNAETRDKECPFFKKEYYLTTKPKLSACFGDIVRENVQFDSAARECNQVGDLRKMVVQFHKQMISECNLNTTIDHTDFFNFMEFSLNGSQFKNVYTEDRGCIINHKNQINDCVNETLGYPLLTNYSQPRFYRKVTTTVNKANCKSAETVKNCTLGVLSDCKPTTRVFVGSLFDYQHKKCENISDSAPNDASSMKLGHQSIIMSMLFMLMTSAFVTTRFL